MCIVRLCKALSHFAGKQQDIPKVVTASFLDGIIQVCYLLQISWVYFFVFKFFTKNRVICEIFHKQITLIFIPALVIAYHLSNLLSCFACHIKNLSISYTGDFQDATTWNTVFIAATIEFHVIALRFNRHPLRLYLFLLFCREHLVCHVWDSIRGSGNFQDEFFSKRRELLCPCSLVLAFHHLLS